MLLGRVHQILVGIHGEGFGLKLGNVEDGAVNDKKLGSKLDKGNGWVEGKSMAAANGEKP